MRYPTAVHSWLLPALCACAVAAACAAPGAGEPAAAPAAQSEVGAFVTTLGRDTIAVERFRRTGERIEGRHVLRTPRTAIRDYTATLTPEGTIANFTMTVRPAPDAQPAMQATIDFGRDTATVRIVQGDSTRTVRVPARAGAIPALGASYALYELPLAQLRESGRESAEVQVVPIGGAQAGTITLRRQGADSVIVTTIAGDNRARVGPEGRLLSFDGRGTTFQVVAERAGGLDVDALAADYAARDERGQGFGGLSPRDSVQARVGGASIMVDYSRPLARGRTIFGNVVPHGEVWRTGANQATQLRTDRDLVMGGTPIPAGSYTLFTIPSPTGWTLIVNRQTGQWGTAHDPAQDLARIPMQRETLPQRVEQFTISIEPEGRGGVLRMAWDDTRASVPFTVR